MANGNTRNSKSNKNTDSTSSSEGPEKKFRAGAIVATVWRNTREVDGDERDFFSVSIERRYKDKNDEWQSTNSYGPNELAKLQAVTRQAFDFMVMSQPEGGQG